MINAAEQTRTPWHLWVIGLFALFWSGMGAFDYVMTHLQNTEYLAAFTEEQRAYYTSFPSWAVATWALATWGGVVGALLLLMKSRFALPLLLVSLLAMVANCVYMFGLSDGLALSGVGGTVFSGVIVVIALLMVIYAQGLKHRGVLR